MLRGWRWRVLEGVCMGCVVWERKGYATFLIGVGEIFEKFALLWISVAGMD